MISSFVVSLVLYPSPLSLLPLPALVCAVLYVGNGFSGMGENGPKNERGSLYTYNNQKRNRGPEVPKNWMVIELLFQPHRYILIEGRNFWQSSERKHWGLCLEIELGPLPPMSPFLFSFLPPHSGEEPWIMTRGDEVSRESQSSLLSPWIASAVPWLHGR